MSDEQSAAGKWLSNSFNQVVIACFAPCAQCDAPAGQPCEDATVVGTIAHTSRVLDGRAALLAELEALRGA